MLTENETATIERILTTNVLRALILALDTVAPGAKEGIKGAFQQDEENTRSGASMLYPDNPEKAQAAFEYSQRYFQNLFE